MFGSNYIGSHQHHPHGNQVTTPLFQMSNSSTNHLLNSPTLLGNITLSNQTGYNAGGFGFGGNQSTPSQNNNVLFGSQSNLSSNPFAPTLHGSHSLINDGGTLFTPSLFNNMNQSLPFTPFGGSSIMHQPTPLQPSQGGLFSTLNHQSNNNLSTNLEPPKQPDISIPSVPSQPSRPAFGLSPPKTTSGQPFTNERPPNFEEFRSEMLIDSSIIRRADLSEHLVGLQTEPELIGLSVRTLTDKLKSSKETQRVPVLVSLQPIVQESSEKRKLGLDLVVLVDVSGSMEGDKLDTLVESLRFIVDQLTEHDRISLISFNHMSNILANMQPLTSANKKKLNKIILSLSAGGGTSIRNAIVDGFDVLLHRKEINDTTAILLLSDGRDNSPTSQSGYLELLNGLDARMAERKMNFAISCFGYGQDHDEKALADICDSRGGNFYYIRNPSDVDEAVLECVGFLMSVIATDIELNLTALGKHRLGHKYGAPWAVDGDVRSLLRLPALAEGLERNFVLDLMVPTCGTTEPVRALALMLTYSVKGDSRVLLKEFEIECTEGELGPECPKVHQNIARLKAVEVLKEAKRDVEAGRKEVAGQLVDAYNHTFLCPTKVGNEFASKMNGLVSRNVLRDNKQMTQNVALFGQQRTDLSQNSLFPANSVQMGLFGTKKGVN